MINSFNNYLKQGKVKKKTYDFEEAKALFEKAKNRIKYTKSRKLSIGSAQFILEDSYEAIRESAQALMSINGYKPYSHESTISFIKEFYNSKFTEEEIHKFDRFRQLRNNSIYKAEAVSLEDAKDCIYFAIGFIKKIKSILKVKK